MATDVGTLLMKVDADTKQFENGIERSKKSFSGFKTAVVVGAVAAGAAIVGIGAKSIKLAQEQEKAEARLEAIAKKVTKATDDQVKALKNLAAEQQKVSTFGDEVLIAGQSQLLSFGLQAEEAGNLTESLANLLAATKGMNATQDDAVNAANMLGKAFDGQVGALSRAGILLNDTQADILKNGTSAEKTAALVEIMNQNYGGLAETLAQTSEGQFIQAKNAIGDIGETIGNILLPAFNKIVSWVASKLPDIQNFFDTAFVKIKEVMSVVSDFISLNVIPIFNKFKENGSTALETIQPIAERVFGILVDVATTMYNFYKDNLIVIFEGLKEFWENNGDSIKQTVMEVFNSVLTVIESVWSFIETYLLPIFSSVVAAVVDNFPTIWETMKFVWESVISILESVWSILDATLIPILEVLYNFIKDNFPAIEDIVGAAFEAVGIAIESVVDIVKTLVGWVETAVNWLKKLFDFDGEKLSVEAEVIRNEKIGGAREGSSNTPTSIRGQRANGGPVMGGSSYLVGEKGPEIFTPSQSGQISTMGNVTINVNGANDPMMVANEIVRILNMQGIATT